MFLYGAAKHERKYDMGLILLEFWAEVKVMGVGMLFMHTYQVISRGSLHHDPSRVIFEAMAQRH